ncbi:hypothetical protein HELRODRAFT_184716 [Helobdella robusta]|uniref:Uncharacterized protein n=1 Tax=Helobdella robusta TaxID=6412 RepID=T1FLU6_HELRO|nr:hypothetical protein HELRODRAFT_184716 [Helobdella robusta]ESO03838.1 hypothetical protein HELRODRAFT_184716 [Helobdella robusta]
MNFENRWVLRSALNFASDGEVVREGGREFQRKGPDLAKECLTRVKKEDVRISLGTFTNLYEEEEIQEKKNKKEEVPEKRNKKEEVPEKRNKKEEVPEKRNKKEEIVK